MVEIVAPDGVIATGFTAVETDTAGCELAGVVTMGAGNATGVLIVGGKGITAPEAVTAGGE